MRNKEALEEPRKRQSRPMEVAGSGGWDLLNWLGPDTSACVFHRLDDPTDLARAAAVSRSWRQFVIANEFCKSLCLRICPEVASFTRAVEVSESPPVPALAAPASGSSHDAEKDHRTYSNLGGALVSSKSKPFVDCIGASSTDRFPAERMENTLDPREVVGHRPSYWSSGGQYDPDMPESLAYRLRPYKVFFMTASLFSLQRWCEFELAVPSLLVAWLKLTTRL